MATASWVVSDNRGATLTVEYDSVSLQVSRVLANNVNGPGVPVTWQASHNGVPARTVTVQPGTSDTWNVPAGSFTLSTIQGHPVIPQGWDLSTWT